VVAVKVRDVAQIASVNYSVVGGVSLHPCVLGSLP